MSAGSGARDLTPGRIVYVDALGGAAGDMLLAALLDAGAEDGVVQEAVEAVLPGRFGFRTEEVRRGGIRARLLRVEDGPSAPLARSGGRARRPFRELVEAIDRSPLPGPVARRARAVLLTMGRAESRVHGLPTEDVELHELGEDDTLLDVVGVAAAVVSLQVEAVLVGSLPIGAGPPAAPATLEMLHGFAVRHGGTGETVTPTAAAILSTLGLPSPGIPDMALQAIGYGAGSRDRGAVPNVVRILLGSAASGAGAEGGEAPLSRPLLVMEANLDDLTPELVADAAGALFSAGAVDVWTTAATMKKGRSGVVLSALCDPRQEPELAEAFFRATSTFGVRSHAVRRVELERAVARVSLSDGEVRVKVGLLRGRVVSATPEHDDVAELAARAGRPVRDVYEEAVGASRTLRFEPAEPA